MSYAFFEDFKTVKPGEQANQVEVECSSDYWHRHCRAGNGIYTLTAAGNKHLLAAPPLTDFTLRTEFFDDPVFTDRAASIRFYFRYDREKRRGLCLEFEWNRERTEFRGKLLAVDSLDLEVLWEETKPCSFSPEARYDTELEVKSDLLTVSVAGLSFTFNLPDSVAGAVGFGRGRFSGAVCLGPVTLDSPETPVSKQIPGFDVPIPQREGSTVPYRLKVTGDRYANGLTVYHVTFYGGMWDRPVFPSNKPGQYSAEWHRFQNPYVKICRNGTWTKYPIKNGQLTVYNDNVHWAFLKSYFQAEPNPIRMNCSVRGDATRTWFAFGYDHLYCRGFAMQSGGPSEFIFDDSGNLMYAGESLNGKLPAAEVKSSAEKKIAKQLASDLSDYVNALAHAQNNHYFFTDEDAEFTLEITAGTEYRPEFFSVRARLETVYHAPMNDSLDVGTPSATATYPSEWGVNTLSWPISSGTFTGGVYRIKIGLLYGDGVLRTLDVAFEVIDPNSDVAPPLQSGLPFLYSTPNEQRDLDRDATALWNPKGSDNLGHYFSCAAFTPGVGRQKEAWRVLTLYRRQWFAWLDTRTEVDWQMGNWEDVIAHADYLHYTMRHDHNARNHYDAMYRMYTFRPGMYRGFIVDLLETFLADKPAGTASLTRFTPDFLAKLKAGERMSPEAVTELLEHCGTEWCRCVANEIANRLHEQNRRLRKKNPTLKRAGYGPFNIYVSRYKTAYWLKYWATDERVLNEFHDGFAQFEDYPFSCAYQTLHGAWAAMSLKLFHPSLKLYPEVYEESPGGCPDGAVAYANPPFGGKRLPLSAQSCQLYEYALCFPCLSNNGFRYWDSDGFMLRDPRPHIAEEFVRSWGNVYRHRPVRPLTPVCCVLDFPDTDDRIYREFTSGGVPDITNISENGVSYVNEALRLAGVSAPYGTRFDTLKTEVPETMRLLVLPSLTGQSPEMLETIRDLHESGVALAAVGDVGGLEDLFGVETAPRQCRVEGVRFNGETEGVQPVDLECRYRCTNAERVLETTGGDCVVSKHGDCVLFHADPVMIGHDAFLDEMYWGRPNIGRLQRKAVQEVLLRVLGDALEYTVEGDVGTAYYEDASGGKCLVLLDYSQDRPNEVFTAEQHVQVWFRQTVNAVSCDNPLTLLKENGRIVGFTCRLKQFENRFMVMQANECTNRKEI
ncbi:MAG: hypothetical protein K9N51_05820 [Candidatus Pacebacteria bacterium]|nr:hypothetical protein [Candidatus Paceibacterota bacterium]